METNAKLMAIALLVSTLSLPGAHAQNTVASGDPAPRVMNGRDNDARPGGPGGHRHGRPGQERPGQERPGQERPGQERPGQERPGQERPGKPNGKGGRHQSSGLTSLTTVTGTVGQLIGNDEFVLDGFTLNAGSGAPTTVKFPAHMGQQVQKAIKTGSNVSVTGYTETTPRNETVFRMNSLTAGKTTLVDTPPVRPAVAPETPALVTATGKIADYRLDWGGRVSGLVLDDKTIVSIPPHVAYQLTDLAKKGSSITVQGYPKNLREGQVQLEKVNILRASTLTINGQQYLVR